MKIVVALFLVSVLGLAAIWFGFGGSQSYPCSVNAAETYEPTLDPKTGRPILVELFTSEGCSSCPPADRLLTSLQKNGGELITLSYHVDYWDYLGWKDRFSSAEFTKRQEAYARQFGLNSTYTPQMVVNGESELVGSNRAGASEAIKKADTGFAGTMDLNVSDGKLTADIRGLSSHTDATVYLAVAESGLVTKVGGGENSGSTLEHSSVVRRLIEIGKVKKGVNDVKLDRDLPRNSDWKNDNLKYVVFVQDKDLKILAAAVTGI